MLSVDLSTVYELICTNLIYVVKWIILVGLCTEKKKPVQSINKLLCVTYASIKTLQLTFLFESKIYTAYFKNNLFLK